MTDIMETPFEFVCMTDDPRGLAEGIKAIEFPPFAMDKSCWHRGMWPKVCAFAPDLFAAGTPVIMMDVDVLILRDLTPLFDRVRAGNDLHIIREIPDTLPRLFPKLFGKELKSNSSTVGFVAGTQNHLYLESCDKTYDQLRHYGNDQNYIHRNARNRQSWPAGWILSFKKSLAWHFPVNLVRPIARPDGYVVIFHGKPDPEDMTKRPFKRWGTAEKFGYFPVRWIKDYWYKYLRDTDQ
ncbi:putative nucleotide-diphospho-sugar transferase [Yoonia tamlensis]|uniref:putative nucleotide-diphospho-sugar transferase n=1 Tax=Yoonia tamlensis TaxID=390270 RepID=UPI001F623FB9|nr:putative nucleotide-diphospho-sugar transferase [Yoonia tamlensis]